jgi:hypothetical protein
MGDATRLSIYIDAQGAACTAALELEIPQDEATGLSNSFRYFTNFIERKCHA